jgi:hypothetical protein
MEGNFLHKRIGEQVRFRNAATQSSEKMTEILHEIIEAVSLEYQTRGEKAIESQSLEDHFGPEIYDDIAVVVELTIKYFSSLGIESVRFGELFVFHKDEQVFDNEGGLSVGISVVEPNINGNLNLKRLVFLKTLVHELYHTTAVVSFTIKNTSEQFSQDNLGASYTSEKTKAEGSLLEEGLASIFEDRMFEKVCEQFDAETVDLYYRLTDLALAKSASLRESVNYDKGRVIIGELDLEEPRFLWSGSTYAYATEVVRLLEEVIPNFATLAERVRVYRETVALAREIEVYFGKGSYRLITTATPGEARDVLAKLTEAKKI